MSSKFKMKKTHNIAVDIDLKNVHVLKNGSIELQDHYSVMPAEYRQWVDSLSPEQFAIVSKKFKDGFLRELENSGARKISVRDLLGTDD